MVEMELRTGWLLQIPARALHTLIAAHLTADQQVRWLREQNIRFRDLKAALNRLTVEQLIRLINAYPADISDAIIEAEFKEYRHGRSPTLQLYSLPAALTGFDLAQANQRAGRAVQRANRNLEQAVGPEEVTPRLRQLALEPFLQLADWPGGLHVGYHCQSRLDYIAPGGQATSTYQLLYGHVWVDLERAFVALHVHPAALEPILVQVLSQALGAPLSLVRVDKGLKRDLKFLQKASCRRIRLVDPTPDRQRFGSITLADDEDLARRSYLGWSYQEWENDFPEMASARYYARFVQDHETSLSIGVRRGSLTLSGGIATSDLRGWARDTGAQIVVAWRARQQQYRQMPPAALDHERLWEYPLLEDFPDDLRRLILGLVQALATIKERQDPQFRAWPLPMRTYDLALAGARREAQEGLGQASRVGGPASWFRVMMRVDCPEVGCLAATECLVCPACGRPLFTLAISDLDEKVLMCANANCRGRWAGAFPLQTQCEEGHLSQLDWDEGIGQRLELFVGRELGFLIQQLLEGEAAVYHYNAARESLWVRDETLVYQPVRPAYEVRQAGEKTTIVSGGAPVIMGSVEVRGDFVGRDKVVMAQHPTCPELGARL
jgi:hypothetical protein